MAEKTSKLIITRKRTRSTYVQISLFCPKCTPASEGDKEAECEAEKVEVIDLLKDFEQLKDEVDDIFKITDTEKEAYNKSTKRNAYGIIGQYYCEKECLGNKRVTLPNCIVELVRARFPTIQTTTFAGAANPKKESPNTKSSNKKTCK